jgi:hypothetical protein
MDHQAIAQLLGNYGEFIGAIAVVATLGYLAVQIRQSNVSAETSAIQDFFNSWEWIGDVDVPLIHALRKGYSTDWNDIPKDEQVQLHMYWANYLVKLHMGYRLQLRGVLDQASYIGFEDFLISALKSPALREWWAGYSEVFPSDFSGRLEGRISDPGDPRPIMTTRRTNQRSRGPPPDNDRFSINVDT